MQHTDSILAEVTDRTPRLSIIVATWNAARTLDRCLSSIVRQDFTAWELLIADGGSNDGTVDLIRKFEPFIAWWQSRPDEGIYDAWNQALRHARGEYVCFLGADDALANTNVLSNLFCSVGLEQYDLVTSCGLVIDACTGKERRFGSAWNYDRIGRRIPVCHPGLLHRRSLFERHGEFDRRYKITGDLDFLLRLPANTSALHVNAITTLIETGGVSRTHVFRRLHEQRKALSHCGRYGPIRAYLVWLDKLWRLPIAHVFNIPY